MAYVASLEAFAGSVESKTYELHEFSRSSSMFNVTHFYYYENADGVADFMPTSTLEEAFVDLLREYPLLAGVLNTPAYGRYTVVVDRDRLNLPEFKVTQCETDFARLKETHYAPSALPAGAATMGRYMAQTGRSPAKLARVHIMRCKGNSGVVVFAAIAHALVDGASFNLVMQRWSAHCKHRARPGPPDAKPSGAINFDHAALSAYIERGAPQPGAYIRHQFISGGPLTWFFNLLSPSNQNVVARLLKGGSGFGSHFYRISQETIDKLLVDIRKTLPAHQRVSAHDAISALINIAMAQSLVGTAAGDPPSSPFQRVAERLVKPAPKMFEHFGVADVRPRLGMGPEEPYCGDAVVVYRSHIPMAAMRRAVTPEMLAQVALATRKGTNSVDKAYIHAVASTIASEPDCTVRAFAYGVGPPAQLVITNHSRFGDYLVDFGWGAPTWTNIIEEAMTSYCYICPPPPGTTGVIIHLLVQEDIHQRMHELQFWKNHTEFIR
ncbi:hypothetical protein IWQ57_000482 [Coemansia nantahalensis]|uniref:Uncharacterized protein n=1 Tax=Coemansia nantahalensis TaxID=2789366 RepID=A0ACC1K7V7_9FUNG|nr:hypothetical protein IWQ57_000482 [Coemansia nantahalensis]